MSSPRLTGRPKREVDLQKIHDLVEVGMTLKAASTELGIPYSSLKRRLKELGLTKKHLVVQDVHLDSVVDQLSVDHPAWGRRMIEGHLTSYGWKVPQKKIMRSIQRTQPLLAATRRRRRLRRRVYYVPFAHNLSHIDGNHHLISWKFVIHGMRDGFSGFALFCACSPSNTSRTVYELFKEACISYGLPDRVRSDKGGENVRVCEVMLYFRGTGTRAFLTGKSVHNQRIERFWVEANKCTNVFYEEFIQLEREYLLERSDPVDIYCLHVVYKPKIDLHLKQFLQAWNNHKIDIRGGKTPVELFVDSCKNRVDNPVLYPAEADFQTFEQSYMSNSVHGHVAVDVIELDMPDLIRAAVDVTLAELRNGSLSEKNAYVAIREVLKL